MSEESGHKKTPHETGFSIVSHNPAKTGNLFYRRRQKLPDETEILHSCAADTEFVSQLKILGMIFFRQVTQEAFAAVDQSHQTASAAVIFFVAAHVFSDFRDTGREKSDLDFGRTDIAFFTGVLADDLSFFCLFHNTLIS